MLKLAFPDPLRWQAGLEYGLQALAVLQKQGIPFICYLHHSGGYLEAVAFAVHELQLDQKVRFVSNVDDYLPECQIAVFPRVYPLGEISVPLAAAQWVITSDPLITPSNPHILIFPRRDWQALAQAIQKVYDYC